MMEIQCKLLVGPSEFIESEMNVLCSDGFAIMGSMQTTWDDVSHAAIHTVMLQKYHNGAGYPYAVENKIVQGNSVAIVEDEVNNYLNMGRG